MACFEEDLFLNDVIDQMARYMKSSTMKPDVTTCDRLYNMWRYYEQKLLSYEETPKEAVYTITDPEFSLEEFKTLMQEHAREHKKIMESIEVPTWHVDTAQIPPKRADAKCECGAEKVGIPFHSDWCEKSQK